MTEFSPEAFVEEDAVEISLQLEEAGGPDRIGRLPHKCSFKDFFFKPLNVLWRLIYWLMLILFVSSRAYRAAVF